LRKKKTQEKKGRVGEKVANVRQVPVKKMSEKSKERRKYKERFKYGPLKKKNQYRT